MLWPYSHHDPDYHDILTQSIREQLIEIERELKERPTEDLRIYVESADEALHGMSIFRRLLYSFGFESYRHSRAKEILKER